jgi:DNA-binding response OmpR family regulator
MKKNFNMTKTKNKILIVDDEESLSEALRVKFELDGFEVFIAKDGEEGLDIAMNKKPDIILLDIIMPKMDGLTMLKYLRTSDSGKSIPVIVLSNLSDDEKIAEALATGSHDYLIKSDWKIEDVVKRVKEKLGR